MVILALKKSQNCWKVPKYSIFPTLKQFELNFGIALIHKIMTVIFDSFSFFTKLEYLIVVSKTAQTMLAIGSIFAFSNVCTKYNQCHNSKVYIVLDLDLKFYKCHHILLWAISFKIYSHESFRLHLHYTVNSKTKLKPASFHSFSKTYIKSDWILHSMLLEDNISS